MTPEERNAINDDIEEMGGLDRGQVTTIVFLGLVIFLLFATGIALMVTRMSI